jgi:hypothetical protein
MRIVEFTSSLDDYEQNRIRVRLTIDGGNVKDVMYQYETVLDNEWQAIVRYDCAHGFFHRDVMYPNGSKEKQVIAIDTLKNASKYAEQDLKNKWEWYRERYTNNLK